MQAHIDRVRSLRAETRDLTAEAKRRLEIAPSFSTGMSPGIGHFFMAWRIDAFREPAGFMAEIDAMLDALRSAPVGEGQPSDRVLVPGDPEAEAEAENRRLGIPIRDEVLGELKAAGEPLGIPFTLGN